MKQKLEEIKVACPEYNKNIFDIIFNSLIRRKQFRETKIQEIREIAIGIEHEISYYLMKKQKGYQIKNLLWEDKKDEK